MGSDGLSRLRRTAVALLVPLVATGLALTGCSQLTGGVAASGAPAPAPAGSTSPEKGSAALKPLQSGALPVLATHDIGNAGGKASVDLNEVRVTGKVAQVTFTARNDDDSHLWDLGGFFADGVIQWTGSAVDQGHVDQFTVDGVYLIDPVGAKRYLAARAADGSCACSDGPLLDPGGSATLTVLFAAPPAGVDALDVHIPGAAPFTGAPVSR
jgi:hypothetical protein